MLRATDSYSKLIRSVLRGVVKSYPGAIASQNIAETNTASNICPNATDLFVFKSLHKKETDDFNDINAG